MSSTRRRTYPQDTGNDGHGRDGCINALEVANTGDLKAFGDYPGGLASVTPRDAASIGRRALAGNLNRPSGNGGHTVGTTYLPPLDP